VQEAYSALLAAAVVQTWEPSCKESRKLSAPVETCLLMTRRYCKGLFDGA
jgi:hypothetical protein